MSPHEHYLVWKKQNIKNKMSLINSEITKASNCLQTERRWISVKERLPQEYDNVLVLINYIIYEICFLRGGKWNTHFQEITHWMPLPPLPKQEVSK